MTEKDNPICIQSGTLTQNAPDGEEMGRGVGSTYASPQEAFDLLKARIVTLEKGDQTIMEVIKGEIEDLTRLYKRVEALEAKLKLKRKAKKRG
jgi:hypothetical protein